MFPSVSYLGNNWTDCAESWCVIICRSVSYAFYNTQGRGASARAHVRTPFLYLENGWTDRAEIWYVVRVQLSWQFTSTRAGVHLHVRTCVPLFRISGTAGRTALKFGILSVTS